MIENFLQYLRQIKFYKENTARTYRASLQNFQVTMGDRDINTATADDIAAHIERLRKLNYKEASIALKMAALRAYFKYLIKYHFRDDNPAKLYPQPSRKTYPYPTLNRDKLIAIRFTAAKHGQRPAIIIELLLAGLKLSEILKLTVGDLNEVEAAEKYWCVRVNRRVYDLDPTVTKLVNNYLEWRRQFVCTHNLLITTLLGLPISGRQIRRDLDAIFADINLDSKRSTYILRNAGKALTKKSVNQAA